ncbi:CBS domain protein [uncultured archaeon]|nr:CBS domain protein [uncultured archaeon]
MEGISWIKDKRRQLGITQQSLARLAGVSQSLIAKVEAGRIDPAYSKARSIIAALEREGFSREKCARDIMHPGIETVSAGETLHSAAAKMRKRNISQMPVVESGRVVGSISEQAVLAHFSSDPNKTARLSVGEAMEQPFPSALPSTPISAVAALLRHYPAVLVMDRGEIAGIITKADLLKTV